MPATKMRNTAAICCRDTGDSSIFMLTDESFPVCLTVRSRMPDEMILSNLEGTYNKYFENIYQIIKRSVQARALYWYILYYRNFR